MDLWERLKERRKRIADDRADSARFKAEVEREAKELRRKAYKAEVLATASDEGKALAQKKSQGRDWKHILQKVGEAGRGMSEAYDRVQGGSGFEVHSPSEVLDSQSQGKKKKRKDNGNSNGGYIA